MGHRHYLVLTQVKAQWKMIVTWLKHRDMSRRNGQLMFGMEDVPIKNVCSLNIKDDTIK